MKGVGRGSVTAIGVTLPILNYTPKSERCVWGGEGSVYLKLDGGRFVLEEDHQGLEVVRVADVLFHHLEIGSEQEK